MKYFLSKLTCPFLNLSFEEYLFSLRKQSLLFYQNSASLIIGRNQNPFKEIVKDTQLQLVRRNSGGGTVYQDLGNSNYCHIMPREMFERKISVNLVSKALNNLGIPSKVNCRYDIVIDGKKVSGSAYKLSGNSAYHHGTMLISTDLDILTSNLTSKKSNLIEGGGVDSVRSLVTRLRNYHPTIDHNVFVGAVMEEFQSEYGKGEKIPVDGNYLELHCPQVFNRAVELKSRKWLLGQTPKFTVSLPNVILNVKEGIVDYLGGDADPEYNFLIGMPFDRLISGGWGVRNNREREILVDIVKQL